MSDLNTWWVKLGDTLAGGIKPGSLSGAITGGLALGGGGMGGSSRLFTSSSPTASASSSSGVLHLTIPVYLDGREIARDNRKKLLDYGRLNPTVISGLGVTA